jgi:hypothetical protein
MERLENKTTKVEEAVHSRGKGWCHDVEPDCRCKGWCHDYQANYNMDLPQAKYFI